MKHLALAASLLASTLLPTASFADPDPANWDAVLDEAKGQTVYWNAWGGSPTTNAFIEWAGDQIQARYGVTLEHVKLTDTADAVTRVLSEKQAGQDDDGAIDMIWINGANFASMKDKRVAVRPLRRGSAELAVCRCGRQNRPHRLHRSGRGL